ncbi:MAG: hypothetical protein PVI86_01600 [Phycisphaerae bacterium]|jgi:hypothetical protein
MWKNNHSVPGVSYLAIGLAALAMAGVAHGADRTVLCEEFTATW